MKGGKMYDIYLASSWRNSYHAETLRFLESHHWSVYNFRKPIPGDNGFHWSEVDRDWQRSNLEGYQKMLKHPLAEEGFEKDFSAMSHSKACVLLLPCGRSAHLEAGWFIGKNCPTYVYTPPGEPIEPELMYKMATGVYGDLDTMADAIKRNIADARSRYYAERR